MKTCIKYLTLFIFIFAQLHFVKEASSQSGGAENQWKAMPLRTSAQYEAGLEGGEGLQAVQGICYSRSNPDVVYLCVDTSNVWKSTDGGNTWTPKPSGFRSEGARSLGVDPLNENVVFAAGMYPEYDTPVTGIYRTTDGGNSWEFVKETYYSKMIDGTKWISGEGQFYAFDTNSYDGTRCQTIYAGSHEDGVMKSTDGGNTWSTIGLKGKRISDIELVNINETTNVIYVATNDTSSGGKGLYKITDSGGITVSSVGNLPDYPRTIAVDARDVNNVIIYACAGTYGAYKSTDGGNTFSRMNTGSAYNGLTHYTIEVSPSNPDRLYVGLHLTTTNNPLYSSDGGANWSAPTDLDVGNLTATGYGAYYSAPMAIHPTNENIVLAYFKQTVMQTTDGGATWEYSGNGYLGGRCTTNKTSAYFDKEDPNRIIYFLMDYGPFITYDKGQTWTKLPVPANGLRSTPVGTSIPDNPDIIITAVGTWNSQHIVRSTDAGETWKEFSYTTGDYKYMGAHPQDNDCIYAGSEEGSWRSDNAGASWTYISDKCIRAMYPGNGDILYATKEGSSNTPFWYSTDRGATWSKLAALPNRHVIDVDIDPFNPKVLYAASGNGLYAFDGANWSEVGRANGLPGETFGDTTYYTTGSVVVDSRNPNTIYTGLITGMGKRERFIYKSEDRGNTWENIGYNLPGYSRVWSLAVNPNTGDLHMSISHGNYVLSDGS